jgi:hypothetical protein
MDIVTLNLPAPSESLTNIIDRVVNKTTLDLSNKQWLEKFHNDTVNVTLHKYGIFDQEMLTKTKEEYENFFHKHKIIATISVMRCANTHAACMTPHIDRGRTLAINCFIKLGGDNVVTTFYNNVGQNKLDSSQNFTYDQTGGIKNQVVFNNAWYAFNVNRIHSVENITGTRCYLSIRFLGHETTFDLQQLILDYPNLIKTSYL